MIETSHLINVQSLLLMTRGYTEPVLGVSGQPKLFLLTLEDNLSLMDKQTAADPTPVNFSHSMNANFENGRFPVALDFAYKYLPSRKDLSLISLTATLFDVVKIYPMEGKRNHELPSAAQLLKDLKADLTVGIHKAAAKDKTAHSPGSTRRHRK